MKERIAVADGKLKLKLILDLGWAYRETAPDSSLVWFEQAFQIAQKSYKEDLPKVYNFMGVAHFYKSALMKSLEFHQKALEESILQDDSLQLAHAYNSFGRVHFSRANYATAYKYFYQALAIFNTIENDDGKSYCYQSLSRVLQSQKKYEEAIEMSEKSLEVRERLGNELGQISAIIEISKIRHQQNEYETALKLLEKAQNLAIHLNDSASMAEVFLAKSKTYSLQENYSSGLNYAELAERIMSNSSNKQLATQTKLQLGVLNLHKGNMTKAKNNFLSVLEMTKSVANSVARSKAYESLSKIASDQNNYEEALDFQRKYTSLLDSILNEEKSKEIGKIEGRMSLVKAEQENLLLKEEQLKNANSIEEHEQKDIYLFGFIGFSLAIMFLMLWKHRQVERILKMSKQQRKELDEQYESLKMTHEKLESVNQEKDALMGIVAHDLKAPLNRVKGYVQIMSLIGGLDAEQHENLKGIEKATENGRNLIRDILDVTAYEQSELTLQKTTILISEFIQNLAERFQVTAQEKDIKLLYEGDNSLEISSNESLMDRIMDNLVSNAIKFSPKGKKVTINWGKQDEEIYFKVSDQGPGFSKYDQNKAFKKFTKLSAKPTAGEHSTGLGLAIVRTLTERLGGKVVLQSEAGKGAQFTVLLKTNH
ncbi:MAG: signal transduction histidine kinase/uncharacterized protein HemY [Bacteroidia bacterium]|jgi:signal transduction histidine kinase/uncharacterized protein HemY